MTLAILEHLLKEAAEVTLRSVHRRLNSIPSGDFAELLAEVYENGCTSMASFWSPEQCAAARAEIDSLIEAGVTGYHWRDALGSDKRIFYAESAGGNFERFCNDPVIEQVRGAYTGFSESQKLVMAARMDFVSGNSGSGNGWHRDSPHRSQFKAILYLSDCSMDNGPFQYIRRSHKAINSIRLVMSGGSRPNQYRFTNDEVQHLIDDGCEVHTSIGKAGTLLLVDTKGLHRGSPITSGSRYAMTLYCFDRVMPKDFLM